MVGEEDEALIGSDYLLILDHSSSPFLLSFYEEKWLLLKIDLLKKKNSKK